MTEPGYNGWTNYQTWVMNLWLTNDEGNYDASHAVVREALDEWEPPVPLEDYYTEDPDAATKARIWYAGERLNEWASDMVPELEGFVSDLFNSAWGLVDWVEIAENMAQELAEEDA